MAEKLLSEAAAGFDTLRRKASLVCYAEALRIGKEADSPQTRDSIVEHIVDALLCDGDYDLALVAAAEATDPAVTEKLTEGIETQRANRVPDADANTVTITDPMQAAEWWGELGGFFRGPTTHRYSAEELDSVVEEIQADEAPEALFKRLLAE